MRFAITLLPRAIRRELVRVEAEGITVQNLGDGLAVLHGSRSGAPFRWQGWAREILNRLQELPDAAGPDAVISAFPPR